MYLVIRLSSTQTIEGARRFPLVSSNDDNQVLICSHQDPHAEPAPGDDKPFFNLTWNTTKGLLIWRGDRSFFYHAIEVLRCFSKDFSRFHILNYRTEEEHLHFWETEASYIANRAPQGLVVKVLKNTRSEEVLPVDLRRLAERLRLTKALEYLKHGNTTAMAASFDSAAIALARLIADYENRQRKAGVDPRVRPVAIDVPQAITAYSPVGRSSGHAANKGSSVVSLVRTEGGRKSFTNLDADRKLEPCQQTSTAKQPQELNEKTVVVNTVPDSKSSGEEVGKIQNVMEAVTADCVFAEAPGTPLVS
jgi:hypothetical protein